MSEIPPPPKMPGQENWSSDQMQEFMSRYYNTYFLVDDKVIDKT